MYTKFIFSHPVYLRGIRVKFVYEGHHVKVKVTGAKTFKNAYAYKRDWRDFGNVKLRSAITPFL